MPSHIPPASPIATQMMSELPELRMHAVSAVGQDADKIPDNHLVACYVFGITGDYHVTSHNCGLAIETLRKHLVRPVYIKLIKHFASARLHSEGVAVGVNTLISVMQDTGAAPAARVAAAKAMREWTQTEQAAAQAVDGKTLQEMTVAELSALVDKLQQVAQTQANTIDVTPDNQ